MSDYGPDRDSWVDGYRMGQASKLPPASPRDQVEAIFDFMWPSRAEPVRLTLRYPGDREIVQELRTLNATMREIHRSTRRRPRIIECRHPELHPEIDPITRANIMDDGR